MAIAMNDKAFAKKCDDIFQKGSQWVDENLFNGEYYEHKITDPKTFQFLDMADPNVQIPFYQLGSGCLVDQLVGQYMAHVCGLGYLAQKDNVQTALKTVMKFNYVERFDNIFNNMRSYVMDKESGLIMASWPKGRLKVPFPYFAESMSGFEYAESNRCRPTCHCACIMVAALRFIEWISLFAIKAVADAFYTFQPGLSLTFV